jgi:hypothetical protein
LIQASEEFLMSILLRSRGGAEPEIPAAARRVNKNGGYR